MGKMAAQKLMSQGLNGDAVAGEVEPRLVIRESSGPVR
jgi:hypothetical protein